MTNKEYITTSLAGLNVAESDIDIILLRANIDAGGMCGDAEAAKACDMAIYNRFSAILKAASQNVSEGGYSVSWNIEAVKMFYNALCNEIGKPNVLERKPSIRHRNIW